jgi:hypothetical protein
MAESLLQKEGWKRGDENMKMEERIAIVDNLLNLEP